MIAKRTCEICGGPIRRQSNEFNVCSRNPTCYKEQRRRYWVANREKGRERDRRWRAANRQKIKERDRRYWAANREKLNERSRQNAAARLGRNPLLSMPRQEQCGHLHPRWSGGENAPCAVPGCHRMAGWRTPRMIKRNKTGFRCSVHKGVKLPQSRSETMSATRIDHLWKKALDAFAEVEKHSRLTVEHADKLRRASYRFAAYVLQMQKDDYGSLMGLIASTGKTVSQWMDDHFGVIEAMCDTRERIFAAIEAGVTEREYMARDSVVIARKRIKSDVKIAQDDGVIPEPSSEPMTPEERVKELVRINESLRSKYQGARKRIRIIEQELGQTTKRMRQLERTIKRLKKDLESLEIGQGAKANV